jgi:DNA topoisomerase-1
MRIAQRLYEGVELGEEGSVGLITYMRTDSTRISGEAIAAVRQYIDGRYGKDYLPEAPNFYKSKKDAQDAHEAIRPTGDGVGPGALARFLDRDELALYTLIWNRFVASQMQSAVFDATSVDVEAGRTRFRANGQVLKFDGFIRVYTEGQDDVVLDPEEGDGRAAAAREGQTLKLLELLPSSTSRSRRRASARRRSSRSSRRRASAVRPRTRASWAPSSTRSTSSRTSSGASSRRARLPGHRPPRRVVPRRAQRRVHGRHGGRARPHRGGTGALGRGHEALLGAVREGPRQGGRRDARREARGAADGPGLRALRQADDHQVGRRGEFLACSGYPECKNTKNFRRDDDGTIHPVEPETTDEVCEKCGRPMQVRFGRYGKFLGCSAIRSAPTSSPSTSRCRRASRASSAAPGR